MTAEMNVTVDSVCSLPPGCDSTAVTADGHDIAFGTASDGRFQFLWDGAAVGRPFDDLFQNRDESLAVYASDDGEHVAYIAKRGDKLFVGRDDRQDAPFDQLSGSIPPTFGGPGLHLAYGAHAGDDYQLIVDGEPVNEAALAPIAAVFSPDGERLAYAEMRNEAHADKTEFRIVLDRHPGDWFRGMRNLMGAMQFSPDGRRFAYYEVDATGKARWVVDGVGQRWFNDVPPLKLARTRGIGVLESPLPARFSPDSRRFAYFADVVEKGVAIVEDDVPGPLFKGVTWPMFSPDSRRLAYMAETFEKTRALVVDDQIVREWPAGGMGEVVFSPDSGRVAVTLQRVERRFLRKREMWTVAVDGRSYPGEPGDDISLVPVFSPHGDRVAWYLQRGSDSVLVIKGVVQTDGATVEGELRFDALGRIVHAGRIGASHTIFIDGRPGPLAEGVSRMAPASELFRGRSLEHPVAFRLSADGSHVAWAGVFGGKECPVLDDEVGPAFDRVLDCGFVDNGAVFWWAQRGAEVVRVTRH